MSVSDQPEVSPPQTLRVCCSEHLGAGVIGGIHLGGAWSQTCILGSGKALAGVLQTLRRISLLPGLPEDISTQITADISELQSVCGLVQRA